jgi:hypothetical protein
MIQNISSAVLFVESRLVRGVGLSDHKLVILNGFIDHIVIGFLFAQ